MTHPFVHSLAVAPCPECDSGTAIVILGAQTLPACALVTMENTPGSALSDSMPAGEVDSLQI